MALVSEFSLYNFLVEFRGKPAVTIFSIFCIVHPISYLQHIICSENQIYSQTYTLRGVINEIAFDPTW